MAQFARYPGSTVGAVGQGGPNTIGNAWPVKPTDGTNSQSFTAGGAAKVDGSAVTQPVSAASLPLPTGAATSAKQPALGTAGTASGDVLTVQGIASMTALKVDGSAVTQPVSATSLPLPTGAATSAKQPALGTAGTPATDVLTVQGAASMTALKVDGSAVTQPVSATSLPLPTGASTSAKQPALGTAGTASGDVLTVQGIASMTALKVDGSAVTQPVSGTVTANAGTGTFTTTQTGIDYNTGAAGATTQRVVEAGRSKAWLARNDYTSTPVTTSAYVQLVASTGAATTRLRIFDSSGSAMILAIGAAASEVDTLYIPPGGWDGPVELQVAASSRVSLKALDATASVGQIIITALS